MVYSLGIDVFYAKGIVAQQKSYGNLRSWRSEISFAKSQQVGRFLNFHAKLHVLSSF